MPNQDPLSPTFDGNETAEQTGTVADASGTPRQRPARPDQTDDAPEPTKRPDEAAHIVP